MTVEVTITEVENDLDLYCHYQGQTDPQDCYIELDCESGDLSADYNSEIGNAVPFSVWNQRVLRFGIPTGMKAEVVNYLMEEIKPLAMKVLEGYECSWNGNNHVGSFTDEADEAQYKIESMCGTVDMDDCLAIWDAEDWFSGIGTLVHQAKELGITSKSSDDDLEQMSIREEQTALSEGIILKDALESLTEIRDSLTD